jgi:protease I
MVERLNDAGVEQETPGDHYERNASMSMNGNEIAFLVAAEGVEQVELSEPWTAMEKAGGQPLLIVEGEQMSVQAFNHLDKGDTFTADLSASHARADDFDGLVLPGGVANPDFLRTIPEAVAFARAFVEAGTPVAVICHGPWTLIEADGVRGRRITSWPSLQTDLPNAGADWADEEVIIDRTGPGPLISSRKPDDLPAFTAAITGTF